MLRLHPAAASRSPRAPDPRPACAGWSHRAALAENAARVFARSAFLHYFSKEISRWERGIRTSENSLPRRCVNEGSSGGPYLMRGGRVAATVGVRRTAQRGAADAGR